MILEPMVKGNEQWLEKYREEHPGRVHDPNEDGKVSTPGRSAIEEKRVQGEAKDEIRLVFNALPPTMNNLLRMNRYKRPKLKRQWAWLILEKTNNHVRTPAHVHIERRSMGRHLDVGGLYSTLKVPLDAMILAGVIPEDDPDHIASISAEQESVGAQEEKQLTIITLTHKPDGNE